MATITEDTVVIIGSGSTRNIERTLANAAQLPTSAELKAFLPAEHKAGTAHVWGLPAVNVPTYNRILDDCDHILVFQNPVRTFVCVEPCKHCVFSGKQKSCLLRAYHRRCGLS